MKHITCPGFLFYFLLILKMRLLNRAIVLLLLLISPGCNTDDEAPEAHNTDARPTKNKRFNPYQPGHTAIKVADSLYRENQIDRAVEVYDSLFMNEGILPENSNDRLYALNKLIQIHISNYRYEKALQLAQSYLNTDMTHLHPDLSSTLLYHAGVAFNFTGKADSAIQYHQQSLALRYQHCTGDIRAQVRSYLGLGNVYRYLTHEYEIASHHYEKAVSLLHQDGDSTLRDLRFRCYYNLMTTYRTRKNLDRSIYYGKEALRIASLMRDTTYLKYCHSAIANNLHNKASYGEAMDHYQQTIRLESSAPTPDYSFLAHCYSNMGIIQRDIGDPASASRHFNRSLGVIRDYNLDEDITELQANLGLIHHQTGNMLRARAYLTLCLEGRLKQYGPHHALTSDAYRYMAELNMASENYKQALDHIQNALESRSYAFATAQSENIPAIRDMPVSLDMLELVFIRAKIFQHLNEQEPGDTNYLAQAFKNFKLAHQLLSHIRQQNVLDTDELSLSNKYRQLYDAALACIYRLLKARKDAQLYEAAFQFMEQNKYGIMLGAIRESLILARSGLPDSLIQKKKDHQAQLIHWQNQLPIANDSTENARVEQRIFENLTELDRINDRINEQIPTLSDFINAGRDSLSQILSNSPPQTLIIEFYESADYLYRLSASEAQIQLDRIELSDTLLTTIRDFQQLLHQANPFDNQAFQQYCNSGDKIYKQLMPAAIRQHDRVYIIPDGILSFLPFEALLTKKCIGDKINYKSLPYLLHRNNIIYQYAAFLISPVHSEPGDGFHKEFGGWAYQKAGGMNVLTSANREIQRSSAGLSRHLFINEQATKENFLSNAEKYKVLHLAVHGYASGERDSLPALHFFAPQTPQGRLKEYELYKLTLRAKMAVLSACETGVGQNTQGEGVFSMARAFLYAGCPAVVMSLWKLNDNTTSTIVIDFYDHLKSGMSKNEALRQAKLQYLQSSDEYLAHPVRWAGIILVGNEQPIPFDRNHLPAWIYIIVGAIAVLAVFISLYVRKRVNKSSYNALDK